MRIKKFLLFTAPAAGERKDFAGSFDTRDEAIEEAGKIKGSQPMWWQVIETATAECVAEDPGWAGPKDAKPVLPDDVADLPAPSEVPKAGNTEA